MTAESEEPADRAPDTGNTDGIGAMNAAERVIEHFGGIRPMAAKLEIPVTTVQGWKKRGVIPFVRHSDIRAAAARHGVQLDAAELAATDPGEGDSAAEPPVMLSPASPPPDSSASAGSGSAAGRVAIAAAVIAVIGAVAAGTAPMWSPRLFPAQGTGTQGTGTQGTGTGDIARELERRLNDRLAALETRMPQDPADRIGALEKAVASVRASLDARPAEAGPPQVDPALLDRMATLEQRVSSFATPTGPDPAVMDRLARFEQRMDSVAAQLQELRTTTAQTGAIAQSVQTLQSSLRELQGSTGEIRRSLTGMEGRHDDLAATVKQMQRQDMRTEAAVLALGQLRVALQGSEPFAGELATARGLAASTTPEVAAALDGIAPYGGSGAPTRAQLRERFEGLAGAIVRAGGLAPNPSWTDEALNRLTSLVTIRREAGEAEGDSTSAVVARAEARLQANDLSGAIDALATLSGRAAEVAAPWIEQARARLALDRAAARIAQAAIARVGAPAPDPAAQPAGSQPVSGKPTQ